MNGLIIIPAYNSAKTLNKLLELLNANSRLDSLVVNDGSSDNTKEIAEKKSTFIIKNSTNLGKGKSLQKGFDFAKKRNYEFVITIDSDLQHPPEAISKFIELHKIASKSIIIGNRKLSKDMPIHRKISNYLTSKLISIRIGQKILDSQCGYRLIPKPYYEIYKSKRAGFHFESELIFRFGLQNVKFEFVEIPTIYNSDIKSNMNNLYATYDFIKLFIESLFWKKGD
ncbi:MAG: glycosyltransferase family 2 protein [Candidatus Marinimicrobia bacterium]|nr:glycosyltransferase family 2 protein [Candidatus Neomarinimicrobiota bacterium]